MRRTQKKTSAKKPPKKTKASKKQQSKKAKPEQNILDFFQNSPLFGLELDFERDKSMGRDIDLGE